MSDDSRYNEITEQLKNLEILTQELQDEKAQLNGNAPIDESYLGSLGADDEGNAQAVFIRHKDKFLYCEALGWLWYTGTHWSSSLAQSKLTRAITETLMARAQVGLLTGNEKLLTAAKPKAGNVKNCQAPALQSLLEVEVSEFDNNPEELNVKNGVLNLRTGELSPHDPKKLFTYCVPTEYKPEADSMPWYEFILDTVMPADKKMTAEESEDYIEVADWLKRAAGYTLTGETAEQCMFYIQGPTRAGKGLFVQTLQKLLGKPLAAAADFDMFTVKRSKDTQNFDLASLREARFVAASEGDKTSMLNAKRLKNITGGDEIKVAHKYKKPFDMYPKYKIWLTTNHEAVGDANDDALWGRLRAIQFPNSYLGKEDFNFGRRLQTKESLEAVLAWAVEGAIQWYKDWDDNKGLGRPKLVKELTEQYQEKNDIVGQFIEECCIVGSNEYVPVAEMTAAFKEWCEGEGIDPLGGFRFRDSMRAKGFTSKQKSINSKNKRSWIGVRLVD